MNFFATMAACSRTCLALFLVIPKSVLGFVYDPGNSYILEGDLPSPTQATHFGYDLELSGHIINNLYVGAPNYSGGMGKG